MATIRTRHRRVRQVLLSAVAVSALVMTMSVGTALAWVRPTLAPTCAADANHYSWEITLTQEPDYLIQLSWSSNFANPWLVNFASKGTHHFDTDRAGPVLYARWKNDTSKSTSASGNGKLCFEPTPTPTIKPTPTPTATPRESELPGNPTPTPLVPRLPDTAITFTIPPGLAIVTLPVGVLLVSMTMLVLTLMRRR